MAYKTKSKERDDTMAAVSKPVNGAFILNSKKAEEFFAQKVNTSSDAIRRYEKRKTKTGDVASKSDK
ncbi:MAG: hypothetical protein MJ134_00535 [Lachnospiraceae bacterium]|nr:hypothetical protein [Lachnospiraceae bacterium]